MTPDLINAHNLLDTGNYTCVLCRDDTTYTATDRGVAPLLNWVNAELDLHGFSAADRVVGRATAFLYVLLGVKEVYATVMSKPAADVLTTQGISASWGTLGDGIINRRGNGPCPFEAAVMDLSDPQQALDAIRNKMAQMRRGN